MRRRQAYHVPEIDGWTVVNEEADAKHDIEIAPPKGYCPKCGKHIGKGIAGHKKACQGVRNG